MLNLTYEELLAVTAACNVMAEHGAVIGEQLPALDTAQPKLEAELARMQRQRREAAEELDEPGGKVA